MAERTTDSSGSPEAPAPSASVLACSNRVEQRLNGPVVTDEDIGREVQGRRNPEEIVEPLRNRAGAEGEVVIDPAGPLCGGLEAEVPFADRGGAVTVFLGKRPDRGPIGFDQSPGVSL